VSDSRVEKFADILVDYSTRVKPGDRVGITLTTAAEPLARALYARVLEKDAFPYILMDFAGQEETFYAHAGDGLLDWVPQFQRTLFEDFDVLIKARSEVNTRALTNLDPARQAVRSKALSTLIAAQMRRGAEGSLRWMSTQFPTPAYAMEAGMGSDEYTDFFFRACHADPATPDPVAFWDGIRRDQQRYVERFNGGDKIEIRGPNAELTLSIQGRTFINACGTTNLPDGEIFTGPVESSVNGWVRYSFPAMYAGRVVDGIELTFEDGKVVRGQARENDGILQQMLNADPGSRYLGEFAIGMNYEINRFTKSILLDEKIGGSFHTAIGAGYPETGSLNRSSVHWDMICDLQTDSEIRLDGEVVYRNGRFTF
jgi:aminopeptidase